MARSIGSALLNTWFIQTVRSRTPNTLAASISSLAVIQYMVQEYELLLYKLGSQPDIWLIKGLAHRCAHCGTLMRPHPNKKIFPEGRCPIRQCNSRKRAKVLEKLDPTQDRLLIAKPQILTYWTGPAIDELEIFDTARQHGLNAELYPESDLCDVSINERAIGIDAKSYTSPVSLALRLNRSI
ncbi:hypothetical protein, partial [Nostoc sp. CHAB 5715]|uniref:restriction endonuclease-related protein n=1 Tax=Nostoc sp. CHAB 5715 TaxID=2780400 RepID=UPI001E61A95F